MSGRLLFGRRERESTVQQVAPAAWRMPVLPDTAAELWVVADAAQGIGLELTKQLLEQGKLVIAMSEDCFSALALQQTAAEHPQHLTLLDLDAHTEASITQVSDMPLLFCELVALAANPRPGEFARFDAMLLVQMVHRVDFTLRTASGPRRAVDVFAYATKHQAPLPVVGEVHNFRLSEFQQVLHEEITVPFTVAKMLTPAMRSASNPRVVVFASEIEQDYCVKKSAAYMLFHELRSVYSATLVAIDPAMEPTEVGAVPDRIDAVFRRTVESCIEMIHLLQPDQSGQLYSVRGNSVPW